MSRYTLPPQDGSILSGTFHKVCIYIFKAINYNIILLAASAPAFSYEGIAPIRKPRVPSVYIRDMSDSNLLIPGRHIQLLEIVGQGTVIYMLV